MIEKDKIKLISKKRRTKERFEATHIQIEKSS